MFIDPCTLNRACSVLAYKKERPSSGCATFISPDKIVCSRHIISGAEKGTVLFINNRGETAKISEIHKPISSKSLDLIIVALDRRIGPEHCPLSTNEDIKKHKKGWLLSCFQAEAKLNPVKINYELTSLTLNSRAFKTNAVAYTTATHVGPGYSGSAVLNEHGHLVNILNGGPASKTDKDIDTKQMIRKKYQAFNEKYSAALAEYHMWQKNSLLGRLVTSIFTKASNMSLSFKVQQHEWHDDGISQHQFNTPKPWDVVKFIKNNSPEIS